MAGEEAKELGGRAALVLFGSGEPAGFAQAHAAELRVRKEVAIIPTGLMVSKAGGDDDDGR